MAEAAETAALVSATATATATASLSAAADDDPRLPDANLVVADIGGTNARFALARVTPDGAVAIGAPVLLGTSDFVSLRTAWAEFAARVVGRGGAPLPRDAAVAIAAPITGDVLRMTNNSWTIDTGNFARQFGLDRTVVLNDFAAIAHAAARAADTHFQTLCGPDVPLPGTGTISVLGPGTGLGVAYFHRAPGGYHVHATEGGHIEFGPVDRVDDAILARLRARHGRVSVERVVSGPAIADIHEALEELERRPAARLPAHEVWARAAARSDPLAVAAVERFCMSLGSVAGDYALAHGATGVVIAGGVAQRLGAGLRASSFAERFRGKGRYEQIMAAIPVKLITHPQPGLFGAAAAFAREHLPR